MSKLVIPWRDSHQAKVLHLKSECCWFFPNSTLYWTWRLRLITRLIMTLGLKLLQQKVINVDWTSFPIESQTWGSPMADLKKYFSDLLTFTYILNNWYMERNLICFLFMLPNLCCRRSVKMISHHIQNESGMDCIYRNMSKNFMWQDLLSRNFSCSQYAQRILEWKQSHTQPTIKSLASTSSTSI